jgi:hypothetical protein
MANKLPKSPSAQTQRTLSGDIRRLAGEHPITAGVTVVALAAAAFSGVVKLVPKSEKPVTGCMPLYNTPFKGSEFGGTVSGVAKYELDRVLAEGKIDTAKITDTDYATALGDLTTLTGLELNTTSLNADRTYELPNNTQVCITQYRDGNLSVDTQPKQQ